jgi:hypothetical protein
MPLSPLPDRGPLARQRGLLALEFALISIIFLALFLGVMEFGRWLFVLTGANEATRLGARLGVVCSVEAPADLSHIKARMSAMTGGSIPAANMVLDYLPANCDASNCRTVIARIEGARFSPISPFFAGDFPVPSFPTSLPREYMNSVGNPVCP